MGVTEADWTVEGGYDLHVLRGTTARGLLVDLLLFDDTTGDWVDATTPPADVQGIRFDARFDGGLVGGRFTGHGIEVDPNNGQVTALAVSQAVDLRSFLVEAVVTVDDPANPGASVDLEPVPVRIHVHMSIVDAWLTPSRLTIREGANGQRFTMLAQFDDDTFGDITRIGEVDGTAGITWVSTNPANVDVDADGGLSVLVSPSSETITATLSGSLGGDTANGDVDGVTGWGAQPAAACEARLVSGPGDGRLDDVPNVLLVSDGFTAAEGTAFDALVDRLERRLRRSRMTRPFDLLADSINYWSVFIPSRERGASALQEVVPVIAPGRLVGDDTPDPLQPTGAGDFTLEELVHQVGLPVPGDENVAQATKVTDWQTLYGAAEVPAGRVTAGVYLDWQLQFDRRLVDERDTALGMATGSRPAAHGTEGSHSMGFHPLRTTRAHLDPFLISLTAGGGPMIGKTWRLEDKDAGIPAGKDHQLVFVLSGGAPDAGATTPGELVAVGVADSGETRLVAVAGTSRFEVVPHPLPRDRNGAVQVAPEVHATVAHETTHALGLLDEYSGERLLPATQVRDLTQAGNVQPDAELRGPAGLDGRLLRWRWPRIAKAGVLDQPPFPQGGGTFRLVLRQGHGVPFRRNDIVHLRQRPLLRPPAVVGGGVNPAAVSPPLEITTDPAGDELIVRERGGPLNPALFPAVGPDESIVFSPVPAPASAPGDTNAELVAAIVREHIRTHHGPLNAPANDPTRACQDDDREVQRATNLPTGLPAGRPKFRSWIIGAYDGGAGFDCGVYHPAGACLMRALRVPRVNELRVRTPNPGVLYRFCAVCRYVLVDRVDPSKHGAIDADYAREYPQP